MRASTCSGGIFDFDAKDTRIRELEEQSTQSNFWNDNERAQAVLREINALKAWTESWKSLSAKHEEIRLLFELGRDEGDESVIPEIQAEIEKLRAGVENLEFRRMLDGEDDHRNAIMTIHPGAGGTESQDWAQMLFRMYLRYAERKGFSVSIMDTQDGEEAGLKSATLEVKGPYAFGFLKAEAGVHRLVRISPFDSNKRRHTSFASIFVYPELEDDIQIVVNPNDLRIDTYRASGAGGQHVNKTSSAVRITHIPSGIVVQCQNERSQHQNKANAMKILLSKLYQKQREEDDKKREHIEKQKKAIAWGSQIRSYVFHPYNLVKDHRTDIETGDIQGVMDGKLEPFIRGFLLEYS